ncbi:hypothetical protein, partial [Klebsiella quasipneumoniae]|uniref:hypothetical protein n=1 Tax=Klebsiella quasipneumoniae TaxID=1463165 RepID=UPI001A7E6A26
QASNKAESSVERLSFLFLRLKRTPFRKVRGFLLCGVCLPRWRCAYRGYGFDMGLRPCGADKLCSTDSGKNIA